MTSRKEYYKDEIAHLRGLVTATQNENAQFKEIVKKELLNSKQLLYALNNEELEKKDATAADYFGVNIIPYIIDPKTQSNVRNTIMYDTVFNTSPSWNSAYKFQYIRFLILAAPGDLIDRYTGIPRHDLIGQVITDLFANTNKFGAQCRLIDDKGGSTDSAFASRDMYFEIYSPNNRVRDKAFQNNIVRKDFMS